MVFSLRKLKLTKKKKVTIRSDDILTVLGSRGCGKTWLAKYLAQKFPRLIVWNYMLEPQLDTLGFPVSTPRDLMIAIKKKISHIVYNPMNRFGDRGEAEFELVNKIVYQKAYNYCFLVEEADRFVRSKYMPFWFGELINRGRHHGIALIVVARRIFRLNPDVPYNSNHVFIFGTIEGRDLKYLSELSEKLAEAKNLPTYHYLWWQRGKTVVKCKPITLRKEKYKRGNVNNG